MGKLRSRVGSIAEDTLGQLKNIDNNNLFLLKKLVNEVYQHLEPSREH